MVCMGHFRGQTSAAASNLVAVWKGSQHLDDFICCQLQGLELHRVPPASVCYVQQAVYLGVGGVVVDVGLCGGGLLLVAGQLGSCRAAALPGEHLEIKAVRGCNSLAPRHGATTCHGTPAALLLQCTRWLLQVLENEVLLDLETRWPSQRLECRQTTQ
jgi:hypothetical protein